MPDDSDHATERPPGSDNEVEERRDLLAYGTQAVLDGRAADVEKTGSPEGVEPYVRGARIRLESAGEPLVRPVAEPAGAGAGVSAVARLGETGVMVHTCTKLGRLTVRLVARRSVEVHEERRAGVEAFGVG